MGSCWLVAWAWAAAGCSCCVGCVLAAFWLGEQPAPAAASATPAPEPPAVMPQALEDWLETNGLKALQQPLD
eukprot:SAG31_NODE_23439_length_504_cov_1.009877_1_plen_71_part_10